jgi:hypothetical protein
LEIAMDDNDLVVDVAYNPPRARTS